MAATVPFQSSTRPPTRWHRLPSRLALSPVAAAVRGDESLVYVTNSGGSNTVSVINTATNTVVATIPVGSVPQLLAVSPDGTRVYVPNQGSNTVSVINTATNTVVATIPVGSQPVGAGVSPDGARVYVTNIKFGQQHSFRHQHRDQYGGRHHPRRS